MRFLSHVERFVFLVLGITTPHGPLHLLAGDSAVVERYVDEVGKLNRDFPNHVGGLFSADGGQAAYEARNAARAAVSSLMRGSTQGQRGKR